MTPKEMRTKRREQPNSKSFRFDSAIYDLRRLNSIVKDKDDSAFELWYRTEHARILATLTFVIGDLCLAEDVVDEAFVRAYDRWERVSSLESPAGWTYKVAINLVKRRSHRMTREYGPSASSSGESAAPLGVQEIWKIVSTLPKRQREVVVFRYIGDLTEIQIANVLGITRGTVSQTLRAAHAKLGALISEKEHEKADM